MSLAPFKSFERQEKEKGYERQEEVLMTDDKKDVVIHVTGVSMSGKVRDDSNRLTPKDQRELGRDEARDSEGHD